MALHKAISSGFEASFLLNFDIRNGPAPSLHARLIAAQAQAREIPILQRETAWETYEQEFGRAVAELKQKGVDGPVLGDIDLQRHKDWIQRVCGGLKSGPYCPYAPLNRKSSSAGLWIPALRPSWSLPRPSLFW